MFWKKNKKDPDGDTDTSVTTLARSDPRTTIKTTTAQTETTNTTVQNATIFNDNNKTVTFQTTRQTVTHQKKARITEICSRRTPTPEELEEMLRAMNFNKMESTGGVSSGSSAVKRRSGSVFAASGYKSAMSNDASGSISGISMKSAPKFKSTTSPIKRLTFNYETSGRDKTTAGSSTSNSSNSAKNNHIPPPPPTTTPTLVKTIQTSVTQKNGRKVTVEKQEHRLKMDDMSFKLSSPNSPLTRLSTTIPIYTKNTPRIQIDAKPFGMVPAKTTTTTTFSKYPITGSTSASNTANTYNSPYGANRTIFTPTVVNKSNSATFNPHNKNTTTFNGSKWMPTTTTATTITTNTSPSMFALNKTSSLPISTTGMGKMKSNLKPGYVYIFNNERFDNSKHEYRVGSSEDVKILRKTFEDFKLKVNIITNATVKEVESTVNKIKMKNFTQHSCLVITILSHGNRYEEIAARDRAYSIDNTVLYPILENETLHGKPKIFFIQACKGSFQTGRFTTDTTRPIGSPNEILKCYSSFEGYVSYRTDEGSPFIKALCEHLRIYGTTKNIKDIMEKVTLVIKEQTLDRQIPSITSTLTKPFVFGDYV